MPERPGRRSPSVTTAEVRRTERLTPHLHRVVLGGPELADLPVGEYTDHYVKLLFPPDGVDYGDTYDLGRIRAERPRHEWPRTRTYTVRRWDAEAGELWIDFVIHGDKGIAGPWAATAEPGAVLRFAGPAGAYAPDPGAEAHLLAGDEAALPAIAASVERLPAHARAHVVIEVAGPEDEQKLESAADLTLTWLHRGNARVGTLLSAAVRELPLAGVDVHAFVHGEAGFVKDLRRHLRDDLGLRRERMSVSGYWRLGRDEDTWQATKREFDPPD